LRQYALAQCPRPKGIGLKKSLAILQDLRAKFEYYGLLYKAPIWFLEDLVSACRKQFYIANLKK
jgi:hypothetical protein|tara:strand:+ start:1052 stop:1243 length:192 start_codon:yes stop_codon:yes gene_type:complete